MAGMEKNNMDKMQKLKKAYQENCEKLSLEDQIEFTIKLFNIINLRIEGEDDLFSLYSDLMERNLERLKHTHSIDIKIPPKDHTREINFFERGE